MAAPGVATTRSTFPAAAQSGTPADAVTAADGPAEPSAPADAGPVEPPVPAEAWCVASPATVPPHAVSPIRAPAAISASAPRAAAPTGPPCPPAMSFGLLGLTIARLPSLPRSRPGWPGRPPAATSLGRAAARPGSLGPGRFQPGLSIAYQTILASAMTWVPR